MRALVTVRKGTPALLCECGCGNMARPGSRFLAGHNNSRGYRRNGEPIISVVDGQQSIQCPRCTQIRPVGDFPLKGRYVHGDRRYGYCKPCHSAYQRVQKLSRVYNLSVDDYDAMLEAQNGVCAICKRPPLKNRLAVDHEHATGLIRGLVCWSCNRGLGYWNEDIARLLSACDYLTNPPAPVALGEERFGRRGRTTNKAKKRRKKAA